MNPFTTHKGQAIIIDQANIDTDQIIPKEHLKTIKRTGLSTALFSDWRYLPNGNNNPNFILNTDLGKEASILVTGDNFGCGSSREHAVWALMQYGFSVILAPSFADIFKNNALKNGLLLIELDTNKLTEIKQSLAKNPHQKIEIDLINQEVKSNILTVNFSIDSFIKERLINRLDDIDMTFQYEQSIANFENQHDFQLKKSLKLIST
ncbi:MAG: 3-isopropylmalate dehydratase small subunit [bacterium]|nr:3-isopropylmalate dehydratase small subunit [bacterium]MBU1918732.1 3-isopropylmalate dehydratase small subunit [bacterium]